MRFPREAPGDLLAALRDPSPVLKVRVATALGIAPSPEALTVLVPSLRDASLPVRYAAAVTLGAAGLPEGEAALASLASDPATSGLARPHVLLATIARRRGDLPGAAAHLDRALELQPYQADVLLLMADVRVRQRDWTAARANLEEALRFDPQNASAQQGLQALTSRGH
jgi:Tfp pilus assembly protein PilF